jgi:hypothetical protein
MSAHPSPAFPRFGRTLFRVAAHAALTSAFAAVLVAAYLLITR